MFIEWALRKFTKTISKLSPGFAFLVAKKLSAFAFLLKTRESNTTKVNLRMCFPDIGRDSEAELAKESLAHSLFLFFEFSYMAFWPRDQLLPLLKKVEGRELLDQAIGQRKGVLILVPHFGNFELLELFLGTYYDFAALYSPPKIKVFDKMLSEMRVRHGGSMFPTTTVGIKGILNQLKQGGVSAILPDQVPAEGAGVINASFFGNPIRYMSLAQRIIQKTGCNVVMASVTRKFSANKLNYNLIFRQPFSGLYSSDPSVHGDALKKSIEQVVVESPAQYQWEYKIFKGNLTETTTRDIYLRQ